MKAYKWIVCLILIVAIGGGILFFGNYQSDESTLQQTAPVSETTADVQSVTEFAFSGEAYCAKLLQILNAYRERQNLPAWTQDDTLTSAAGIRAHDCSVLQSQSHTRTDGTPWYTVLNVTENYNYSEITGISGQAAEEMARTWIAGQNSNAGLLSAEYTACGLNCEAIGSDVYVVLILYRP